MSISNMKKTYIRPLTLSLQMGTDQMLLAASDATTPTTNTPGVTSANLPGLTPSTQINLSGAGEGGKLIGGSINDAW